MLGPYDYMLIGGLLVFCLLGLRGGFFLTALLAAGLFGCVALAISLGTAASLITLIGIWFVIALFVVILWPRLRGGAVTARSRAAAVTTSLVEFALVAVLVTGALSARLPENATLVRSAAAYPVIAEAGVRLMAIDDGGTPQPATLLSFPVPIRSEPERGPLMPAARPIDWAEVGTFDNRITRILAGSIVAADRAPISFEVGGTVARVHVEIGERFDEGDILAELDPTELQIALDERRASLIEAEARAQEASLTLDRQRRLLDSGTISQAALDSAEAAAESAQSRLEIALVSIRLAEDRMADAVLQAPYDGVVAARMVEPAQATQLGVPAFEIQDANAGFQIEVTVPETLIGQIEPGSEHRATILNGYDDQINARVDEIGSRANPTTGFPVTLAIVAPTAQVRSGMSVAVHLSLPLNTDGEAHTGHAAVPYTAVLPADGGAHIAFAYDHATGTLERRVITVAGREGMTALVSQGLQPGDIVAIRGLPFLQDGQRAALRGVGIARYND